MSLNAGKGERLRGDIGRFSLFALGFGTIIGSAWVILLNQWLASSGPGGALIGFIAGGIVMIAIGACYAELTARIPEAGGDFVFATRVFGESAGFIVGWFFALAWTCVIVFEGLAVGSVLQMLAPDFPKWTLYESFGAPVSATHLLCGIFWTFVIVGVNLRGGTAAARFQGAITSVFLFVSLGLLLCMILLGSPSRLLPLVPGTEGGDWWKGSLGIFVSCAFLLNGFQTISQVIEERSHGVELRTVAWIIVGSIGGAAAFYCLCVVAPSLLVPWPTLGGSDLAMVAATLALPGGAVLAKVLLLILLASLLKTWNGVFLALTRIFVSLARAGHLPASFADVGSGGRAPRRAIMAAAALNLAGLFLGKGAVGTMVDTSATSLVVCFILSCSALLVLRRRQPDAPSFTVPGGSPTILFALAGAIVMAGAALVGPVMRDHGLPLEHQLLIAWAMVGAGLLWWRKTKRQKA